jgi:hypothetical protein
MEEGINLQLTSKILSLVFIIIIILTPIFVSYTWIPVVWFVEGAVAILLGLISKKISIEKTGWKVVVLGLVSFFVLDWIRNLKYVDKAFVYQYSIINLISILIIIANLKANKKSVTPGTSITWKYTIIFKRFTIVSLWFYMLQTFGDIYLLKMDRGFYYEFYRTVLMLFINMFFLFFIFKSPLCYDKVVRIFSYFCGIFCVVMCLWLDFYEPIIPHFKELYKEMYSAVGILIVVNLIVLLGIREIYVSMKKNKKS